MNDLVNFNQGGIPANPADLVKGLQSVNASIQGGQGGMPFLRLLKSGVYAYGQENIEPEPGSEWAINPYSIMHGWACWGDGELLDERMVPFNQQPPPASELPDYGQPWSQQVAVQLRCMSGEDEGVTVQYKGTSTGLRNAIKHLIDEIVQQAMNDPDHLVPIVNLETDSYNHKKYGQIFYPVLPLVNWVSIDNAEDQADAEQAAAGDPDEPPFEADEPDQKEVKTSNRRRRGAEAKADPEPKPRRRRRAS